MNKHYWGLWTLLLTALLLFVVLSFKTDGFRIGGLEIKTASFAQSAKESLDDESVKAAAKKGKRRGEAVQADTTWRAPMDTTAKNILFIGDSMLEGLGERLAKYTHKNGHTLVEVIWYSSSTKCWAESARLTQLINKYHPNYIFICLGANELYVPNIKTARKPYLKKILAEIGDIPYLWIGPPNWDEDTGINALLADNLSEGCFYYSANDHFTRSRDGAHPTRASAHVWMDRVVKWMVTKCAHPIRLEKPGDGIRRADRIVIYQPPV
jgi:lysophospholipase L1-like esterase